MSSNDDAEFRERVQRVQELARWRWREILVALGIDAKLLTNPKTLGPCPACGGNTRFRFDDKHGDGDWLCHHCDTKSDKQCGAGKGFRLLENTFSITWWDAFQRVEEYLGGRAYEPMKAPVHSQQKSRDEEIEESRKKSRKIWDQTVAINPSSPPALYLRNRGFDLETYPRVLRYHHGLDYWITGVGEKGQTTFRKVGPFPAMVAGLQFPDGSWAGIHVTYLTPDGQKAPITELANDGKDYSAKKLLTKGVEGAAIRLYEANGKELVSAEGIENGFAGHFLKNLPAWVASNAGMLAVMDIPDHVEMLHIYADTDKPDLHGKKAGQSAAKVLENRQLAKGKKARKHFPPRADLDFNDLWLAHKAKLAAA